MEPKRLPGVDARRDRCDICSNRAGPSFDLWTKRSDGSGEPVLEIDEEWAIAEALWSPDGSWFVHRTSTNVQGQGDILARCTDRKMKPVPIVASRLSEFAPAISPNGRWMAYSTTETGRSEIVVAPFPNAGDSDGPYRSAAVGSRCGHATAPSFSTGTGRTNWCRCVFRPRVRFPSARRACCSPTGTNSRSTHRQYDASRRTASGSFWFAGSAGRRTG